MHAVLLRRLDDMLGRGEDLFLAVSHGLIAALVIAAVFFRYVLSDPLTWTEEFIVIVFTWMLFIGLSNAFRDRMHIRIDALLLVLPRGGRLIFGIVAVAVTLVTLLLLAWFGAEQTIIMLNTETPMMRISAAWAVSALPVGAVLSCIHILRHALCDGPAETLWPEDLIGAAEGEVS
jgi:TRAP-type C4-dicarboxylate transport system permease small subunit